jgi:hypothetical protein
MYIAFAVEMIPRKSYSKNGSKTGKKGGVRVR